MPAPRPRSTPPRPRTLADLSVGEIRGAVASSQQARTRSTKTSTRFRVQLEHQRAAKASRQKFPQLKGLPYSVGARSSSGATRPRGARGFTGGQLEGSLLGGGPDIEPTGGRTRAPKPKTTTKSVARDLEARHRRRRRA